MRDIVAFLILGLSLVMLTISVALLLIMPPRNGNEVLLAAGCAVTFTIAIPIALWMLETNSRHPKS